MAKSGSPNTRKVCRYCGLESVVSHASARECIEALERERNELREQLRHGRPVGTVVSQLRSDRDNARAISLRIAPIR